MRDISFQTKLNRARWVERQILGWYQKYVSPTASFPKVPHAAYDIVCEEVGNVEVKEDLLAVQTGNYAFEYQNYEAEASGYKGTTAEEFVIVDKEKVIFMKTESLDYLITNDKTKRHIVMGFRKDDGKQCQGWLVNRDHILLSPYASVVERWFPWSL